MRAWLAILHEKHPEFTWIAVGQDPSESESRGSAEPCSFPNVGADESDVVAQAA